MKNKYEIRGDATAIFINHKGGKVESLIDTIDLPIVSSIKGNWLIMHTGYVVARTESGKKFIFMHRLITGIKTPHTIRCVDHINQNKLDNRRSANLRIVSPSGNAENRKLRRDNKTGIPGVSWDEKKQRYRVNVKRKNLGHFIEFEEAKRVALDGRTKLLTHAVFFKEKLNDNPAKIITRKNTIQNNNSSGVPGISKHAQTGMWMARVCHNRERHYLGLYDTVSQAQMAMDEYRKKALLVSEDAQETELN